MYPTPRNNYLDDLDDFVDFVDDLVDFVDFVSLKSTVGLFWRGGTAGGVNGGVVASDENERRGVVGESGWKAGFPVGPIQTFSYPGMFFLSWGGLVLGGGGGGGVFGGGKSIDEPEIRFPGNLTYKFSSRILTDLFFFFWKVHNTLSIPSNLFISATYHISIKKSKIYFL